MATDWAADVKKYVANADDGAIAGIVRYCGIALHKRDSSLVSFSDSKETDRVRNNFLKKKLALTDSDTVLDAAIAKVGGIMKADRTKNRVTVYYLLADHFGKLGLFIKAGATKAAPPAKKAPAKKAPVKKAPAKKAAAGAVVAGGAAASLASLGGGDVGGKAAANDAGGGATAALGVAGAAVAGVAGAAVAGASDLGGKAVGAVGDAGAAVAGAATAGAAGLASAIGIGDSDEQGGGWSWVLWLLLGLLALLLLWWWLFGRDNATSDVETVNLAPSTEAAASGTASGATDLTAAPAEGTVAIPTGAGVTTEMRDGKPVVKVYFDSGKTDVATAFAAAAGGLKAHLEANAGSSLAVSGFNDPTGSAARNAQLAQGRAQNVQAALVSAGIPAASAVLVPPASATDGSGNNANARRVEVVVR